ncbi:phage tail protein [Asticcacaulis endophyticus]|uniref:P2 phage tail completion protein R (GpR) n=1 Tax=Asticcacaulis endophyticus TaxID=1395890 RepID=A0A918Q3A6_9CAUL|nr:phage tail protein [Asticcacaulis endophyticus]GGZ32084.1 hypothetical protein GCM10011273_17670 [Asticcacaulis endophyticus]
MDKPASLRALITESVPELKRESSNLRIWIRGGHIATRYHRENHGFEYRYTLEIEVRSFSGHPDEIILPIVLWLRVHQPDALLNHGTGDKAITFDADYISTDEIDLNITLSLVEAVDVRPKPNGEPGDYEMTHRAEPDIAGEELIVNPPVPLRRVYNGQGEFVAGYPVITFLKLSDGSQIIGTDGTPLTANG